MGHYVDYVDFSILKGKTLISVEKCSYNQDHLIFKTSEGDIYLMTHRQECCEDVYIDDVCGDFADLLNETILVAEELSCDVTEEDRRIDVSCTWTFYHLSTFSGDVTVKWFGASNGYYSEGADLFKISDSTYDSIKKGLFGMKLLREYWR